MPGKRTLSESEKREIGLARRLKEMQEHPGVRFFVYVADETDDYGEPLVSVMQEDDAPKSDESTYWT